MLGGRAAGMVAATGVVWLTVAVRKMATGSVPGLLIISALVLALQAALVIATESTLVFLLQFPLANLALCVLFARTCYAFFHKHRFGIDLVRPGVHINAVREVCKARPESAGSRMAMQGGV
jgi:hypothetical protein